MFIQTREYVGTLAQRVSVPAEPKVTSGGAIIVPETGSESGRVLPRLTYPFGLDHFKLHRLRQLLLHSRYSHRVFLPYVRFISTIG